MIKRTLYFGNPAYLGLTDKQLTVRLPQVEQNADLPESFKKEIQAKIPVEDIGLVILDHRQITLTHGLLNALVENNSAVIHCNSEHLPIGLVLPLEGNTVQAERFRDQIGASEPLRKQLWQQTVQCKIRNQAALLSRNNKNSGPLLSLAQRVKSGDATNCEGTAAVYYWQHLFSPAIDFYRNREGDPPNNLLNYGYAILRAIVARGLVASGLLPTFGIHHRNRYNAYALADDIMEPFRPFVDSVVLEITAKEKEYKELTKDLKKQLLCIPTLEVVIEKERSPLMVGMQRTTSSLVKCFEGTSRKLLYPEFDE
ncbi:MAG: type II CRISPR-associated endonuclease Cas1 [Bacteroidetes bacterium]|nr:type II CRISPR-associated endonuclease Cas1 [Bacteroidota bacterium]